jgi:DNA-binding NarL/FixJ family response regulator
MKRRPIRLMCVDDNQMLAEALERRVMTDSRFAWAGWIENTGDLLSEVKLANPDIVLMDIDMPGIDAFALVHRLSESSPDARVLMFSAYVRHDYIDRAVENGAWGYVSKNEDMSDILAAIERAADGEFVLTDDVLSEQQRSH